MASRGCKVDSSSDCLYGHFPLTNRLDVNQVPLELNRQDFTLNLDLQGTSDPVYIRNPKKDIPPFHNKMRRNELQSLSTKALTHILTLKTHVMNLIKSDTYLSQNYCFMFLLK